MSLVRCKDHTCPHRADCRRYAPHTVDSGTPVYVDSPRVGSICEYTLPHESPEAHAKAQQSVRKLCPTCRQYKPYFCKCETQE